MADHRRPDPILSQATGRADLIGTLRAVVGRRHVLTAPRRTRRYCRGFRYGEGAALAVVRPATLREQWRVLAACVRADVSIIFQAANTGLTGGSTPDGDVYPGGVVVVSMTRLKGIVLLDGGRQVVCLPGATLDELEKVLARVGREPHSVIGSSCLGASVIGGICNNSGGALVQRGPAFTELALFARIGADGGVELVNHLGIDPGGEPEALLDRLQAGNVSGLEIARAGRASDPDYRGHVREIDEGTPARFNADPRRLFEASGCAGKLAVFAVRLDTFPAEAATSTFYVGTNEAADLTLLRRDMLAHFPTLPISAEYIHRDAFDLAADYGKAIFLAVRWLGTRRIPRLFALQALVDSWAAMARLREGVLDRLLHRLARLLPQHLPPRLRDFRDRYRHHLLLRFSAAAADDVQACLSRHLAGTGADFLVCTQAEGASAFLHRFTVAGAALRYRSIQAGKAGAIVSLDFALPRNATVWAKPLAAGLETLVAQEIRYGHFFCHVFHHDFVLRQGIDPDAVEHRLCAALDRRGALYPAEHNVGHRYRATSDQAEFYRRIDPRNQLNPGIGKTPRGRLWSG